MRTYNWDDLLDYDDSEFDPRNLETKVLPAGEYTFSAVRIYQRQYAGSGKIPPCNMAQVYLRVQGGDHGKGLCSEVFFVTPSMEWKAAAYLSSIGLRKHGEPITWKSIIESKGMIGKCEIYVDEYKDKNGTVCKCNRVKRFIDTEGRL